MNYNELKNMVKAGCQGVNTANFSAEEANVAALNAILEQFGLTADSPLYAIRAQRAAVMSVIEEAINEILPQRLSGILDRFAETKSFARDDEVVFTLKGLGQSRQRLSIVKGARSGIYKAVRLDSREFQMNTVTYTVGTYVTLEEILLGKYTLADLFSNILEGFEEIIYKEVVSTLQAAGSIVPAANSKTVSSFDGDVYFKAVDDGITIAKAYGTPLIVGFRSALASLYNQVSTTNYHKVSDTDLEEIRNNGIISLYHGVQILELPNYFTDNTNASKWFSEDTVFVLASDAKPVKVALRGDLVTVEKTGDTGAQKIEASKMMGVGLALANNVVVIAKQ